MKQRWIDRRIEGVVDALLGFGVITVTLLLPIPPFAKAGVLAGVPLGLCGLAKAREQGWRSAAKAEHADLIEPLAAPEAVTLESERRDPVNAAELVSLSLYTPAPVPTGKETLVWDDRDGIGRNDPCWCGSGKKYKKCHGA